MKKKKRRDLSYRTKLTSFFLLATAITILVGFYNYISSRMLMEDMTDLLNKSQELTSLYKEVDEIQNDLEVYLSTRSSDSLQSFYNHSNSISSDNNILKQDAEYTDRGVRIKNLTGMIDHYLKILDETIVDKRNRKISDYSKGYQQSVKEYNYIGSYIKEIMSTDLSDSAQRYLEIQKKAYNSTVLSYTMFGISFALILVIIVLFSYQITRPITKLSSYAKEVSEGNFEVDIAEEGTSSEIRVLYRAFSKMTKSIREYIDELKEKERLERVLIQEKYDNLKMKNALHEAELLALQSQVNPHFIFNSINIGAKVAMLQGDSVTCEYLENFADIFRYNLKGLDYNASLSEEVNNVSSYMSLLTTRFGDFVTFHMDIPEDPEILEFKMPRMTLQPLTENAYIHGISKLEEGGAIELKATKEEDRIKIIISNTGDHFPQEAIDRILNKKSKTVKNQAQKGHTTGIGMDNVLKRLRLFYDEKDVMNIVSKDGITKVILLLPLHNKREMEIKEYENEV
ncbi:sensor histidine kinase [Anaerocolumna xylanovorans]|uniref:Histidine kinase-, DNA gyrase B-, and HSP90-like ATPase n=1 Tax=Anaerocolumna xylanovorans DSM 12503 TaxID=1121345 RepID=A0A1M7Y0P7_9FIRM|nr:histidine kinase [Anaerocolumna xylanovorans]SHO45151.1 Histidine kinase-, DNA gyrase B-, and HSP90-like ATPase [Anaerocolumna xylanovorans DSM 12503]